MSHWREFSARPLWRASKDESLISTSTSSCSAMPLTMSTSKPLNPVGADWSKSSNGGYGTSEQTVSVPSLMRLRSAAADDVESLPEASLSEPHDVRENASTATAAAAMVERRWVVDMRAP